MYSHFKLLICFCFFIFSFRVFCQNNIVKDTTITSYWENGLKKTETVYKKQVLLDKNSNTPFTVMKVKKTNYYNVKGEDISKKDYNSLFSNDDFESSNSQRVSDPFFDSLEYKINKRAEKFKNNTSSVVLLLGSKKQATLFPFYIKFNPKTELLKYKDTLINSNLYSICVYNYTSDSTKKDFTGALRSDTYKVYYFNNLTKKEELQIDFELIAKEIGSSLNDIAKVFVNCFSEIATATSKAINNGTTKTFAFTLANVILLLSESR